MSQLLDLICTRLVAPKRQADGSIIAQCPACARENRDQTGKNHLRVFSSGAFGCIIHPSGKGSDHNKLIHGLIAGDLDGSSMLDHEVAAILRGDIDEYLDQDDPRLDTPKVYDEALLERLLPDRSYWVGRGIREDVLVRLGGGVASLDVKSKLSGRYVLPCRDDKGRLIGFAGRILNPFNTFAPRWKILGAGAKRYFVFPHASISLPAIRATREVILVEGQGCVMALMSAGFDQCLSLFGVKLSSKLLGVLIGLNPSRIIVATNNEPPKRAGQTEGVGVAAARQIRESLCTFFSPEKVIVALPTLKDFAEMTEAQIKDWYQQILVPAPT